MSSRSRRDPYATLGVARDADEATIKRSYRKRAQQLHPDQNPDDPGAEDRFKELSSAYAVLSDKERRRAYDEFGDIALDPNFDASKARQATGGFGNFGRGHAGRSGGFQDNQGGGFGNLFDEFFQGFAGGPPASRRGGDLQTTIELDLREAAHGCERRVTIARPREDGLPRRETLSVRVPPGVADGSKIRLARKGAESRNGGAPGDLFATIRVKPHAFFERDGRNLRLEVPISIREAIVGAEIEIPTLDGRVNLRIPPSTDGGSRLRLRGKGIPAGGASPAGDLYVTVRIRVPKQLNADALERLEQLTELADPGAKELRAHFFSDDAGEATGT